MSQREQLDRQANRQPLDFSSTVSRIGDSFHKRIQDLKKVICQIKARNVPESSSNQKQHLREALEHEMGAVETTRARSNKLSGPEAKDAKQSRQDTSSVLPSQKELRIINQLGLPIHDENGIAKVIELGKVEGLEVIVEEDENF